MVSSNYEIVLLYHGHNKLIINIMMIRAVCTRQSRFVDFNSVSSQKQQSTNIHAAPLGHIILIPIQPVFALFSLMLRA